jgi:hypothetical protein
MHHLMFNLQKFLGKQHEKNAFSSRAATSLLITEMKKLWNTAPLEDREPVYTGVFDALKKTTADNPYHHSN